MGQHGKVSTIMNAQGLRLACYFWPANTAEPKAVVQLLHGNGAYLMEFLRTQVLINHRLSHWQTQSFMLVQSASITV